MPSIRIERRIRGRVQPNESSSTRATIQSQPIHHHYFGSEHLPSYIHLNASSDIQPTSVEKSNKIMDEVIASLPRSSLATLNPQQHFADKSLSADAVLPANINAEGKKMMKAKKGQIESVAPSEAPIENTKMPPLEPTINPMPRSPAGSSAHLTFTPSISPSIDMDIDYSPNDLPSASELLSKEERTATGIVTTSAIMLLALILFAAFQKKRKRRKSASKLNITDPALCENASVSSERSSTFLDDGDKMANDSLYHSPIKSKSYYQAQQWMTPPATSCIQRQSGVAMHLMKLVNASLNFTKEAKKRDETEVFASLSPYLVDEYTSNKKQSETVLMSSLNKSKENIDTSTALEPHVKRLCDSENDGETLLEESDRLAWRAALDVDYNYNANLYQDKLSDNRRPWRSQQYATVLTSGNEDFSISKVLTLPSDNPVSERGIVKKQKSLDEMSMGSVDFINPDIVQQFKVVDQRLSEGFEQFREVDQRLSDEFDKLEATLMKNGHTAPLHVPDIIDSEESQGTTIVNRDSSDMSTAPISIGLDKPSCPNFVAIIRNPPEQNKFNDISSSINDSDDDDDMQRRYQPPHLNRYFSKDKKKSRTESMTITDSAKIDQSIFDEGKIPSHYYIIPSNPSSLLNLPKSSNGDSTSSTKASIVEPGTDDDDILSTTNDDHDDEYCFQKIRSRFNN